MLVSHLNAVRRSALALAILGAAATAAAAHATARPGEIVFTSTRASAHPSRIFELEAGAKPRNIYPSRDAAQTLTVADTGVFAFVRARLRDSAVVVGGSGRPRLLFSTGPSVRVRISPDGTAVAVWDDLVTSEVVIVDAATGRTTRASVLCSGDVRWSPDSERLLCATPSDRVFVVDRRGTLMLARRALDAQWIAPHRIALVPRALVTQLLDDSGAVVGTLAGDPFAVSHDGRRIALGRPGVLTIVDAATGALLKTIHGPRIWTPDGTFTPDGREFAYYAPGSSYRIVPVDGHGSGRKLPASGVWSSDGGSYAFVRVSAARATVIVGDHYGAHGRAVGRFDYDDHGGSTLVAGTARRFFYETVVRPHADLWRIRSDGSGLRRITFSGDVRSPAWSPDGGRLAFGLAPFEGGLCGFCSPQLVFATPAGRTSGTLPSDEEDSAPTWSPQGRRLAVEYGLDGQIDVVDVDGGHRHEIARGGAFEPAWSPDGRTIAYTSSGDANGIHIVAPTGQGDRLILPNASSPAFSRDGRLLAFVRNGVIFAGPASHPRRAHRVTTGVEPSFAPDSATIVFSRGHGIYVVGIDGTLLRRLTRTRYDDRSPVWRPAG